MHTHTQLSLLCTDIHVYTHTHTNTQHTHPHVCKQCLQLRLGDEICGIGSDQLHKDTKSTTPVRTEASWQTWAFKEKTYPPTEVSPNDRTYHIRNNTYLQSWGTVVCFNSSQGPTLTKTKSLARWTYNVQYSSTHTQPLALLASTNSLMSKFAIKMLLMMSSELEGTKGTKGQQSLDGKLGCGLIII